jgi:hypothetical protein
MRLNSILCSCGLLFGLALVAATQQASSVPYNTPPAAGSPHIDNEFVQKQFGESCTLMPGPAPLKADFDGDGVEDIVIVARCRNPLPDQVEHSFRVVDPYNQYFGFGDPKVTTEFASEDPDLRGISLLIIHGAGPEAWRSATPKAKFLVINLPFKNLAVKKIMVHKKPTVAIFAEEAREGEGTISALYWDGKKYKYQPLGTSLE